MSKSENKRIESKRNLERLKQVLKKRAEANKQPFRKQTQRLVARTSLFVLLFIATLYGTLISSLFIY